MDSSSSNTAYAKLYISINDNDQNLHQMYTKSIENHNNDVLNNRYPNAGFDMFFPEECVFDSSNSKFVSMGIKCGMSIFDTSINQWKPTGYYSYPRSSISKTPLMLANSVGIIDSGYRGPIIGAFRNTSSDKEPYVVEQNARLLQLCAPDLRPIVVELVDESFFEATERGEGGFGSTGR